MNLTRSIVRRSVRGMAAALLTMALASVGWAATNVRYRVAQKPFKQQVTSTTELTFNLYSDDACSALLASEPLYQASLSSY